MLILSLPAQSWLLQLSATLGHVFRFAGVLLQLGNCLWQRSAPCLRGTWWSLHKILLSQSAAQERTGTCRWFTLTQLNGSLLAFCYFVQKNGLAGLRAAWPWPSAEAVAHVAAFGALQAALQLALPGRTFKGPVSPRGNVPVYKVACSSRSCPVRGTNRQLAVLKPAV